MTTRNTREVEDVPGDVLTLPQFLRLPEIKPALEFINGRVVQKVSPTFPHSWLGYQIAYRINAHSGPRKLGHAAPEVRFIFGGESLVPDVCFIARGRLPRDRQGRYAERLALAPDLAVEILSPGQTVKKLSAKLARAVRNGVRLAWLIQPRRNRVFVFRPDQPPLELGPGDVLDGYDVLPGFTLPIDELFGWLVAED
jgi:Uma2 family endonuclease